MRSLNGNEVIGKYGRWKNAVEGKGLRVNVCKTNSIQLLFGKKSSVLKVDPCGVCGERVRCDSIQCRCSALPRQVSLPSCRDVFVCRTCLGHNFSAEGK